MIIQIDSKCQQLEDMLREGHPIEPPVLIEEQAHLAELAIRRPYTLDWLKIAALVGLVAAGAAIWGYNQINSKSPIPSLSTLAGQEYARAHDQRTIKPFADGNKLVYVEPETNRSYDVSFDEGGETHLIARNKSLDNLRPLRMEVHNRTPIYIDEQNNSEYLLQKQGSGFRLVETHRAPTPDEYQTTRDVLSGNGQRDVHSLRSNDKASRSSGVASENKESNDASYPSRLVLEDNR